MNSVLVTGGCGVIGSHLVDALLARGDTVTVIDNLSTGKIHNVEHNTGNPMFRIINDTILNEELMDGLIRECSTVFHLAAAVGVKYICEDPLQGIRGLFMTLGPMRVELLEPLDETSPLEAYLKRGVKISFYLSSCYPGAYRRCC